jgi:hypothetical protein
MQRSVNQLLTVVLMLPLLAACTGIRSPTGYREYLEEATGTTVAQVPMPGVFLREQPGLASSGRDYVYLAPLGISRSGERSWWLWLGVWSTVDRPARDATAAPLVLGSALLMADTEPMELDLQPAVLQASGMGRIPYATPVRPAQEWLVPVTLSQLQRLARARMLTLWDRPAGEESRSWQGDERAAVVMRQFVAGVAGVDAAAESGR